MVAIISATAVMIVGTWLGSPIRTPILVGLALGFILAARAPRVAALAAVLAWGGILLASALSGNAVARLASTLGGAMGVPGWAVVVATLLYPTVLASCAAWLAHLVSPRRIAGDAIRERVLR